MNLERSLFLVKIDDQIVTHSHDFSYANKKFMEFSRLRENKKKTIKFLEYGYVRAVTSLYHTIKKTRA